MAKKTKKSKSKTSTPKKVYEYLCSACSDVAIQTSNKMLGVSIDCANCGTLIELNDAKRYKKI